MDARRWLEFLDELADASDEISLSRFRAADLRIDEKPDRTLVTEADLAIEETARRLTAERHPRIDLANACCRDVETVRLAVLDHLRIATYDGYPDFASRLPMTGASRLPRLFNGRSRSASSGCFQLDLASRTIVRCFNAIVAS